MKVILGVEKISIIFWGLLKKLTGTELIPRNRFHRIFINLGLSECLPISQSYFFAYFLRTKLI